MGSSVVPGSGRAGVTITAIVDEPSSEWTEPSIRERLPFANLRDLPAERASASSKPPTNPPYYVYTDDTSSPRDAIEPEPTSRRRHPPPSSRTTWDRRDPRGGVPKRYVRWEYVWADTKQQMPWKHRSTSRDRRDAAKEGVTRKALRRSSCWMERSGVASQRVPCI